MHMRRRFVVLIDAAGPRLVRLNYYNQMCERCPRTQTDKWNMLANAQIVTTTQFVEFRREWMQERLRERDKQRQQQLQRKQVIPRCIFCGDILESRRRKYCPAPKHCKSRATYERTFRSLGLWRGPNRIEQLKKWFLTSGGSHRYNSLKYFQANWLEPFPFPVSIRSQLRYLGQTQSQMLLHPS